MRDYLRTKKELEQIDMKEKEAKGRYIQVLIIEPSAKTNLKERIKSEKYVRNKVIEKANEISSSIAPLKGINHDELPDNKDLQTLLNDKLAKNKEATRYTYQPNASSYIVRTRNWMSYKKQKIKILELIIL